MSLLVRLKQNIRGNIAVFIDAANIELSAKERGWRVDYRRLHRWLSDIGDLSYCGFFTVRFGTKAHDAFLTVLKKSKYSLVTKPLKVIKTRSHQLKRGHVRKANFDVEIAVEAMMRRDSYNTMVLFSGDSDFDYLIKQLKKEKKTVCVVSMKHHVAKELIASADVYVDLRRIRQDIERKSPPKSPSFATGG